MTELQIKAWGNSAAIRLNKEILGALGAKIGDDLDAKIINQTLTLKLKTNQSLDELFRGYYGTPESYSMLFEHQNWLEMQPEGEELW
jgi:antitoxin component of MazEF toxin-antitoxin module